MQIDDIVNRVFSRSFMGYDMREVDLFLDDIIDQLERYESERKEMLTAMEYLLDKLERGGTLPEAKATLPNGTESPRRKRARNIRTVGPAREDAAAETGARIAEAEAAVAIELELLGDAPENAESIADILPELLEQLSEEAESVGAENEAEAAPASAEASEKEVKQDAAPAPAEDGD